MYIYIRAFGYGFRYIYAMDRPPVKKMKVEEGVGGDSPNSQVSATSSLYSSDSTSSAGHLFKISEELHSERVAC